MALNLPSFALGVLVALAAMLLMLPLLGRRIRSVAARGHRRELAELAAERDRLRAELRIRETHSAEVPPIGDLTAEEEVLRRRIDALADELMRTTSKRG